MNTARLLASLLIGTSFIAGNAPAATPAPTDPALTINRLGSYSVGIFSDEVSGAEITAHDPRTHRLFVVNGAQRRIEVIDIRNPNTPTKLFDIDCSPYGDQPNSVAVHDGVVAVAVQASPKTDPGQAVFFDCDGKFLAAVTVGALPDMITFTPDGRYVLTANEGEPDDAYAIDPEGSVSVIDMRGAPKKLKQSDVRTATFTAFNGAALDNSIRVFGLPGTIAQNLEPEYITISDDSRTAYVTLQENNAIATVDIRSARVTSIKGLGFKDHSRIETSTTTFDLPATDMPAIGTTAAGQTLYLGGFSGLAFEGIDETTGRYRFITHTDRGPNGEPTGINRPFLLPDFAPEIVRLELDRETGAFAVTQRIPLQKAAGVPLTGRPNLSLGSNASVPYNDEIGVDLFGNVLSADPLGADLEGIAVDPNDGSFWLCDEYRPAIYHFDSAGVMLARFVPIGTAAAAGQPEGTYGTEVLPAVLAQRRQNRGFEAIAYDNGRVYAFVQSPARNPAALGNSALNAMRNVRVVEFNPATLATRQFLYVMDNADLGGDPNTRADKIGDAVALGHGEFLVVERDDDSAPADAPASIEKKIYRINLAGATELTAAREAALLAATGKTPDQATLEELVANGINPIGKLLHVDLNAAGYNTVQKVEGIAAIDPWTLAVINDNDFQVAGIVIDQSTGTFTLAPGYTPEPIRLGLIDTLAQGLDASDRDGVANIRAWPVKGMYLPDAIATFKVGQKTFLVTANEGDVREWGDYSEEKRINGITLDTAAFPFAGTLRHNNQLGRLKVTSSRGDTDGDGDYDELYSFGTRSFSIWTTSGELVYDSGDTIEQIIVGDPVFGPIFNAGHTNNTLDDRSDDKGPEPEAVTVGWVGGKPYAFVGLERIGGFMTFDLSDPHAPAFVKYVNHRDPTVAPALNQGGDYGPEGLLFIDAKHSPSGQALLVVSNEVSSIVTLYQLGAQ